MWSGGLQSGSIPPTTKQPGQGHIDNGHLHNQRDKQRKRERKNKRGKVSYHVIHFQSNHCKVTNMIRTKCCKNRWYIFNNKTEEIYFIPKCLNMSIFIQVTINYSISFYLWDALLNILQWKTTEFENFDLKWYLSLSYLHSYRKRTKQVRSTYSPNTRMNRVFNDTTQKTCSCNKAEWYRLASLVNTYTTHTNSVSVDSTLTHQEHQGSI